MDAGELELRKVFEEVTTRNVTTVIDFSKVTREIVRDLEKRIEKQDKLLRLYDERFAEMQKQLVVLQTKLYSGGT